MVDRYNEKIEEMERVWVNILTGMGRTLTLAICTPLNVHGATSDTLQHYTTLGIQYTYIVVIIRVLIFIYIYLICLVQLLSHIF